MLLDESADRPSIEPAIALRPRRPHSGTLAAVQHPELKSRHIRGATHDATECVDLAESASKSLQVGFTHGLPHVVLVAIGLSRRRR